MTLDQIKESFRTNGVTVRQFARANGFNETLVYAVLSGTNKASRGESFRIAVALGLKQQPNTEELPEFMRKLLASQEPDQSPPRRLK
ncbi:DNA-binding protein [Leptospira sp. 96542]|nr:DNA-binding protein [Leptospira sp. 96542]